MTRVLTIGLFYPPHHIGGYEVGCADVMSRLVRRGHEVTVLTSDRRLPGRGGPDGEVDGVAVERRLRAYYRDDDLYRPPLGERWRIERHNQAVLRDTLARTQPEVVSLWHLGALSMGLLTALAETGIPLVYVICDDWLQYGPKVDPWARLFRRLGPLGRGARRLTGVPTTLPDLGRTGAFLFISEHNRRRTIEGTRWQYPTSSIVYMGIDGALFGGDGLPASGERWGGHLLYVGRYDPRKGLATLLRALALLPSTYRLEVQGTGGEQARAEMEELARGLGVSERVDFALQTPRAELVAAYRHADAVVFPSEWPEPFGMVPLEAMSAGTPVVATGVGGSGEFLLDGVNCLRFPAGDAEALAAAVQRLAADSALRRRLVTAGTASARYFDTENLVGVLEEWLDGAAHGFPRGLPAPRRFRAELVTGAADAEGSVG